MTPAPYTVEHVREVAEIELDRETLRERIEAEKARIRAHRGKSWLARLLPFTITIKRNT